MHTCNYHGDTYDVIYVNKTSSIFYHFMLNYEPGTRIGTKFEVASWLLKYVADFAIFFKE